MEEQSTAQKVQKVALPAYLPKRMQAFRVGRGDNQTYVVRDTAQGKNYDFEPWQFFVLEVLPGCEDQPKLATVFQDRFGYPLPSTYLSQFFASLFEAGLIGEDGAAHPVLRPFTKKTYAVEDGKAKLKSFGAPSNDVTEVRAVRAQTVPTAVPSAAPPVEAAPKASHSAPKPAVAAAAPAAAAAPVAPEKPLPAGIQDAIDFDPRASRRMWVLFDPRRLLKVLTPLLAPMRHAIYPLPLLALAACYLSIRYSPLVQQDFDRLLHGGLSFWKHTAYGLASADLLVTLTTAVMAYRYRATVNAIGIVLLMSFIPRFTTRVGNVEQLSRGERMWLHGAPLIVRLFLFSVGTLTWYLTRQSHAAMAEVGLSLALVGLLGLLLCANPLIKSSGYHLLAAFANEPHLRGKAFKTLYGKLRGGSFKEADDLLLATYALASAMFMFVMIAVALVVLGQALHGIQLGGSAIIAVVVVGTILTRRTLRYFGQVEAAYERSLQFERWRKRVLPQDDAETAAAVPKSGLASYAWQTVPLCLVLVLFLPYTYNPGGTFVIFPSLQQPITTDVSGVVKQVFFDGGEVLKKGTVIARLNDSDALAQAAVLSARMNEQRSVIEDLKARPRPQNVALAKRALEVHQTRVAFSKTEADRTQTLYGQGAVSSQDLADATSTYQVDQRHVEEAAAALTVAQMRATPDEIAAAEAKFETFKAEREAYLDKSRRSVLLMPFDGKLRTFHLKEKGNAYYDHGQIFAMAEAAGHVTAEIEVPESDVGYVMTGTEVRARPVAYSADLFTGKVKTIDSVVTEKSFGNVVKVLAVVDDSNGRLRNGMTGYAKFDGPSVPVWKAFSLAVLRFFMVQVWSWIP